MIAIFFLLQSIKIQWTPPDDADDVEAYGVEYSLADDHRMMNVPVSASQRSAVLTNLEENTLYAIRLYCLYESRAGPLTDWFYVSTRTGLLLQPTMFLFL